MVIPDFKYKLSVRCCKRLKDFSPKINGWVAFFDVYTNSIFWCNPRFEYMICSQPFFDGFLNADIYITDIYQENSQLLYEVSLKSLYNNYVNGECDINHIITYYLNRLSEKIPLIEDKILKNEIDI